MSTQCTLYEHINYQGSTRTFDQATSNLVGHGFNDKTSSAKVRGRPWIFYQHVDFKGNSQVINPGDYPTYSLWGANDDLSSLRPLPDKSEGDGVIALFEHVKRVLYYIRAIRWSSLFQNMFAHVQDLFRNNIALV